MSFSFKRAEDSPGFLLWQITNEWQRKQRKALAEQDLTHVQFVVLASLLWLTTHESIPITQQHIAQLANIDKMMVSTVASTLMKKKLVKREKNTGDGRSYILNFTDLGRKRIIKAIPIVEGIDAKFFDKSNTRVTLLNKILNKNFSS
jgi:DNA-binding MarR family transcriptional regulator